MDRRSKEIRKRLSPNSRSVCRGGIHGAPLAASCHNFCEYRNIPWRRFIYVWTLPKTIRNVEFALATPFAMSSTFQSIYRPPLTSAFTAHTLRGSSSSVTSDSFNLFARSFSASWTSRPSSPQRCTILCSRLRCAPFHLMSRSPLDHFFGFQ